mgnify:CR=1 FL=1
MLPDCQGSEGTDYYVTKAVATNVASALVDRDEVQLPWRQTVVILGCGHGAAVIAKNSVLRSGKDWPDILTTAQEAFLNEPRLTNVGLADALSEAGFPSVTGQVEDAVHDCICERIQ